MDAQLRSDPESEHYGAPQPDEPSTAGATKDRDRDSQQSKKNAVRKRTKTGCLSTSGLALSNVTARH